MRKFYHCNRYNFKDENGNILVPNMWFDFATDFHYGISTVIKNNKYSAIKEDGSLISNQWFDFCGVFDENGNARVLLNDKWNVINKDGNYLSEQWFDHITSFVDGFAKVKLDNKYNIINIESGNIINKL